MNFLAHAYLSFGNSETLIGNMIADQIKGKQIEQYPNAIQHGIHIHREIDSFTDKHPITQDATKLLQSTAGRYSGAFLDVAYDHFLAKDKTNEPTEGWEIFAERSYKQISDYKDILPSKFCSMFMYMESENWFYNYRYKWMIEKSFDRLKQRANYLDDNATIFEEFEKNYNELEYYYQSFFPELKLFAQSLQS